MHICLCLEAEMIYSSWLSRKTLPVNLLWILGRFLVCGVAPFIFFLFFSLK